MENLNRANTHSVFFEMYECKINEREVFLFLCHEEVNRNRYLDFK